MSTHQYTGIWLKASNTPLMRSCEHYWRRSNDLLVACSFDDNGQRRYYISEAFCYTDPDDGSIKWVGHNGESMIDNPEYWSPMPAHPDDDAEGAQLDMFDEHPSGDIL